MSVLREEEEEQKDQDVVLFCLVSLFLLADDVARVDLHVRVRVRHSPAQAEGSFLAGAIDGLALTAAAHPGHVPIETVIPTGQELCTVVRSAMGRRCDCFETQCYKG